MAVSWELPAPRDAALTVGGHRDRRGTLSTPQLRGHRWGEERALGFDCLYSMLLGATLA